MALGSLLPHYHQVAISIWETLLGPQSNLGVGATS